MAEVGLGAHEHEGRVWSVVVQLGDPATAHVEEGVHTGHGETDDEDVCVVVAQRAESVVRLLRQKGKAKHRLRLTACYS